MWHVFNIIFFTVTCSIISFNCPHSRLSIKNRLERIRMYEIPNEQETIIVDV
uniref:Uncharacterized protein n=1 Tax=Heterorhabditis bacteriophora TaxID=37862 RepID=A0A1I7WKW1_HETBA